MSLSDFEKLDDEELAKRDAELRRDLFDLRAQKNSGSLKDTTKCKAMRRQIARVQTLLRQRELLRSVQQD